MIKTFNLRPIWLRSCVDKLWQLGLFLTLCFIFVPINPLMPTYVDGEKLATNFAIAKHWVFGSAFIYTYGPWSELYTFQYYPSLYVRTVLMSTVVTILIFALIYKNFLAANILAKAIFLIIFSGMIYYKDGLFYSIIFILSLKVTNKLTHHYFQYITPVVLGIFTLIKGSFILPAILSLICVATFTDNHRKYTQKLKVFVVFIITISLAWIASGQNLKHLPKFFISQIQVIFGYSDAMSSNGTRKLTYLFLITAALMLLLIKQIDRHNSRPIFITTIRILIVLIIFKAAFVRADSHIILASTTLILIAGFVLVNTQGNQNKVKILVIAFLFWTITDVSVLGGTISQLPKNVENFYTSNIQAMKYNLFHKDILKQKFTHSVEAIKLEHKMPKLSGKIDVYSYDQAALIANELNYSPRPSIQSYTAYTQKLNLMDARSISHLAGPDFILFKLQAIDFRLPSQEDGASWSQLKGNYSFVGKYGEYLVFKKRTNELRTMNEIQTKSIQFNSWVHVQNGNDVYGSINLHKSLIGTLVSMLYKLPPLYIELSDEKGRIQKFRIIPEMMRSEFLISPLVLTTNDFEKYFVGKKGSHITNFRIFMPESSAIYWKSKITFSTILKNTFSG